MGGLEDWWNKLHFMSTLTLDDDIKQLMFAAIDNDTMKFGFGSKGMSKLKNRDLLEFHHLEAVYFGRDFIESILIWSIVTEKFIHLAKQKQEEEKEGKLIQAIEALSNYLMFLLVIKPEMLPFPRPQKAHADVCRVLDSMWSRLPHGDDERNSSAAPKCWNPFHVLKEQFQRLNNELFRQDGPNPSSRIQQREELVTHMLNTRFDEEYYGTSCIKPGKYDPVIIRLFARKIWKTLFDEDVCCSYDLDIMLGVWVELLLYAAEHCSRDSHARNLTHNNGGEFITILWLLIKYDTAPPTDNADLSSYDQMEEQAEARHANNVDLSSFVQLGEIDEEELKQYNGYEARKPVLMAIKGQIYDVTESREFYGPGGRYSLFAGKDASRALAKMSFQPEDLTSDISGLEPFELDALQDWEDKFMSKYRKVGSIKKSVPLQREETKARPPI